MYMPGRRRTGSSPSRTVMSSEVYPVDAIVVKVGGRRTVQEDRRRHRQRDGGAHDLGLALQGVSFSASPGDAEAARTDRDLLAVVRLGDQHVFVARAAYAEADHRGFTDLDDGDAAPGGGELGKLVDLAEQRAGVAGDHAENVL